MISQAQSYALSVAWVGGWGFLFFTYPEGLCRIFRMKSPTPKRIKLIRITGAIELAIVFISSILCAIFGFR